MISLPRDFVCVWETMLQMDPQEVIAFLPLAVLRAVATLVVTLRLELTAFFGAVDFLDEESLLRLDQRLIVEMKPFLPPDFRFSPLLGVVFFLRKERGFVLGFLRSPMG